MGKEFGARMPARDDGGSGGHMEGLVVVGRLLECGTCPLSGELHYGLVMPYRPVRLVAGHLPIKAFSLSSSSSSSSSPPPPPPYLSPPVPLPPGPSSSSSSSTSAPKDDASSGRYALAWRDHRHHQHQHQHQQEKEEAEATYMGGPVLWVVHGTPELPRPDYHKFSGGLEEFRVGECHRLRLKVKLDGPSPFDEVVDPYLAYPGQRYLCLKADLAHPSGDDDSDDDDDDDSQRQFDSDEDIDDDEEEEEWDSSEDEGQDNTNNTNEEEEEDEGDGDSDNSGMEEAA